MPRFNDLIGKPFKDGGRHDEYDCWGLVLEVYRRFGFALPDFRISALDLVTVGAEIKNQQDHNPAWTPIPTPKAPCIVLIRFNAPMPNHCGVYLGADKFIHAREKVGVNVDRLSSPAWSHRIEGFYVPS